MMGSSQMHICTGASGSCLVDGKGLKYESLQASILQGTSVPLGAEGDKSYGQRQPSERPGSWTDTGKSSGVDPY